MARRKSDGTHSEEDLERTLTDMGPLLRRRAAVERPDPAFVARLRARLAPDAAIVGARRDEGFPLTILASRLRPRRARALVAIAVIAALVLGSLSALVVLEHRSPAGRTLSLSWSPPQPGVADLLQGFPSPAVARAAGSPDSTIGLSAIAGRAYAGRVRLSMAALPVRPFRLEAFRLGASITASPARVLTLARRLGIRAPSYRARRGGATWLVAGDGGGPSARPVHSLAVSLATGEVVYHDASYPRLMRSPREMWIDNAAAVAAARAWLTGLGWPGSRVPLREIEHSGLPGGIRELEFGWVGVGSTALDAATLWVTPHGRVVEADLWPPLESARPIASRSLTAAWTAVRGGLVPLAVEGVPPNTRAPGDGRMRTVTITHVLTTGSDHHLYLVPTYHFSGTAVLRGIHGERICYALAPAGQAG